MTDLLWTPSIEQIASANLTLFLEKVNSKFNCTLSTYQDLYEWSLSERENFWSTVWEFCEIRSSQPWDKVLMNGHLMPGAEWFSGARLNFAENLLRYRDQRTALVFCGENGTRQTLSYLDLYKQVAALAASLKVAGVQRGDRVAALMPNLLETVIAMLATTSLGGIWSSCSPDFGIQGVLDRFSQIRPKVLFVADGYHYNGKAQNSLEKIQGILEKLYSVECVVVTPFIDPNPDISELPHAMLFDDFLVNDARKIEFQQLPFNHPLYIMYSSGTTGKPKCIVHSAGGTLLQHMKEHVLHTNLRREDTLFYYTTCGWMMWNWLVSGLAVGATVVLYDGSPMYPKPERMFDLIDQEGISVFGTSAKFISSAEKAGLLPKKTHQLERLRTILSTGSPLSHESFKYVYRDVKSSVCLSSISGGTDLISCFALGNPVLPVYRGELQSRGLGMDVQVYNDEGTSVIEEKGELVCTQAFPSMPIYFWNDSDGSKYQKAYFSKYPNIWAHGDYAEITPHQGMIIHGRSDAVLNPGGVRIGTAEIYRQVEKLNEILESIVIAQEWQEDVRIILFVRLQPDFRLTDELKEAIRQTIRVHTTPRHVPAKILQVSDIPRTISGKIVELAVQNVVHGRPVKNQDALANPEALEYFKNLHELQQD